MMEARRLAFTGDPAKALPMLTFARNAFRSTGANFLAPLDLSVLASTHAALGEFDDARRCNDEAMSTIETNKEKWFEAEVNRIAGEIALKSLQKRILNALYRGCALAMTGRAADALPMIDTGMTALRATGATMFSPLYLSYLARACLELGKFDEASRWISEATAAMQTSKESWWEAEIARIEGVLALKALPDAARGEVYFERALAIARKQQAKSWELRAAMSLARLWRDQGKPQQARELLAPVYGWFTEGFDTRDLKEAKALLDVLAS